MKVVTILLVLLCCTSFLVGKEVVEDPNDVTLTTTPLTLTTTTIQLPLPRHLPFFSNSSEIKEDTTEDGGDVDNEEETDDEDSTPFKIPQDAVEFMDYFEGLVKKIQTSLDGVFDQYLPQLFEMSSSVVLSPDCTYDIVRVLLALREMKPWAIKCMSIQTVLLVMPVPAVSFFHFCVYLFHYKDWWDDSPPFSFLLLFHVLNAVLDASGKVPEGILSGTLSSLGAYDECLETKLGGGSHDVSGDSSSSSRIVTGQYCSIDIKPFLPPKPPSNSLNRIFNEAADAKGFPKVSPLVFLSWLSLDFHSLHETWPQPTFR